MNPIKTPREMLFEMVGMPHMATGKSVEQAFTLAEMVKRAIKEYILQNKKQPSAQEIADLKAYAQTLSQPTSGLRTDVPSHVAGVAITPAERMRRIKEAEARAKHELAVDPNLFSPDTARDEFLTMMATGRGQKGTRLAPKVYDVNDPVTAQRIEGNQLAGAYDDMLEGKEFGNITPGATFFANRSAALENTALGSGKIPLIDQLKMQFQKQTGRYPNQEELDAIIANYNPMRHQYGSQGVSIVGSRPPTARGMQAWREQARNEGIPEAYLNKPPADYSKELADELQIQRGTQPGTKPYAPKGRKGSKPTPGSTITKFDEQGNPIEVQQFSTGTQVLSPDQMRFDLAAMGGAPSKFEDPYHKAVAEAKAKPGYKPMSRLERLGTRVNQGFGPIGAAGLGYGAYDAAKQGDYLNAGLYGTSAAAYGASTVPKFTNPALRVAGAASVPISLKEAYDRYQAGDRSGAVISVIQAGLGAAQMHPVLTVPASVASMGLMGYDLMRDVPTARKE